jgi:hypothetical protein
MSLDYFERLALFGVILLIVVAVVLGYLGIDYEEQQFQKAMRIQYKVFEAETGNPAGISLDDFIIMQRGR